MNVVASRGGRRPPQLIRMLRKTGWPAALGLVGVFVGVLMLIASLLINLHTDSTGIRSKAPFPSDGVGQPATLHSRGNAAIELNAPRYETHLDDIALIFTLAMEHGVSIGPVDYRTEVQSTLPVLVRTMELRLSEDYPRFKPFIADVLARVPHLYLQEIRIDRGNGETGKAQFTVRLALVYRIAGPALTPDHKLVLPSPAGNAQP